jgi:hypothetical protein
MFTIRLGLIIEEQSYAPHEPIFKVLLLSTTTYIKSILICCCSNRMYNGLRRSCWRAC